MATDSPVSHCPISDTIQHTHRLRSEDSHLRNMTATAGVVYPPNGPLTDVGHLSPDGSPCRGGAVA